MLEVGIKAPEFTLLDQNGKKNSLSNYPGEKEILFYSKRYDLWLY